MRIADTEAHLRAALHAEGMRPGDPASVRVDALLDVLERFCTVPVVDSGTAEDDGDGVVVQCGTAVLDGVRRFRLAVLRHLAPAGPPGLPAGDQALRQLSCTLGWEPTAATDAFEDRELWSFGTPLPDFFTGARALPGVRWALGAPAPAVFAVGLDTVGPPW